MILAKTSHRVIAMTGICLMTISLVAFAYSTRIEYAFAAYALYGRNFVITQGLWGFYKTV